MNKKGLIGNIVEIFFTLIVGVMMVIVIIPEIKEGRMIQSLDKDCYRTQKEIYCKSIGMELGSIVVTPGGLFGGSPYNKEACVSENSEKIINYKDINYERCLPK